MPSSRIVALLAAVTLLSTTATSQRLIACDTTGNALTLIDPATATRTSLGALTTAGTVIAGELTYDPVAGKLYMASSNTDSLYVVDATNWTAQLVGPFGTSAVIMHGLEWDPSTNTLYGISTHNSGLYSIDTTTGLATLIGTTGLAAATSWGLALGYNPLNNTLYMTSTNTDSLYTIDRATGLATLVGALDPVTTASTAIATLTYDIDTLTMYAIDNFYDNLYSIDLTTGLRTLIGSLGASNLIAMTYIPGSGRLSRQVHGCATTTIGVTGNPTIGYQIEYTLGGYTGFPFVGYGLTNPAVPFCGCTVGHEWAVAELGPVTHLTIPPDASLVGMHVYAQGMDFGGLGSTCSWLQLGLTDTIELAIGN